MEYTKIEGKSAGYYGLIALFGILAAIGIFEFFKALQTGHGDFGSSDRVPWGIPIVMIELLKGISIGLLLVSTFGYVFGKDEYKPISRMAAFLALIVFVGAMAMVLGDIGKPLRFIYIFIYGAANLNSVFALNAFLYSGYFLAAAAYLWSVLGEKTQLAKTLGIIAIVMAGAVATASGLIFGFMIGRELWFSPLLPLLFILVDMIGGASLLILVAIATSKLRNKPLNEKIITGLGKYLLFLVAIVAFWIVIENLVRVYGQWQGEEGLTFFLTGPYSSVFWIGQVFLGIIVPLGILISGAGKTIYGVALASFLLLVGVISETFTLIIPGQDLIQQQVVGRIMMGFEGENALYSVSGAELALVLGVIGIIGILYLAGLRTIKLLPSH
jgi:molybdopterin-containing oxidoreductase family membrane subunit